jgi:thiol reductant ABC exporter CydD subunit
VVRPLDPRLLRYARRARLPIAVLAALGVATTILVMLQAEFLATAISGAFGGHASLGDLTTPVFGLAIIIAARAAMAWASAAAAHRASAAATAELRQRVLARAVELGPSWLAGQRTAELAELVTRGIDDLDGYFTSYLPALVLAAVVPVAVLARIAVADPWSGLVIAVTLPLVPVFGALIGMATAQRAQARWRALAALAHHFHDVVGGLPTLRVFGRATAQRRSIERVTGEYRRTTMATLRLAFLSALALELIATTSVALVAVEIGLRLAAGTLDLRTGLLCLILAPEAYLSLRTVGAQFHATADGLAAAEQAFTILEAPAAGGSGPGGTGVVPPGSGVSPLGRGRRLSAATGAPSAAVSCADLCGLTDGTSPAWSAVIRVDGVSVRHEGRSAAAPDGVSLTISPSRLMAVAGPSGCGKSTLLAVLLGFHRPDEGRVLITARSDAADLRELDPDGWRSMIGWVPQEPALFPGTVADNIRLGWPAAPDEAVRAAARAAALTDDEPGTVVVNRLLLDRVLTGRGGGLSAGQRRRVALARALLPRPDGTPRPVLLLDEPTAGLDARAEARVVATLRAEAGRGRAILVVSHHPAVLAAADEVVTLASAATVTNQPIAARPVAGPPVATGITVSVALARVPA